MMIKLCLSSRKREKNTVRKETAAIAIAKHFEYIFISSLILGVALGMIVWLALIFVECYKESKASKDKTMMEIFKERMICRKTKFAFLVLITTLVLMSLL